MTNNEGKQKAKDKSDERHDSITTQDLFIKGFSDYCKTTTPTPEQVKAAISIMNCRTMRLGGHMYTCKSCGNRIAVYNSCQNRHCPQCEGNKAMEWVKKVIEECLPVKHAHVTLNLPDELGLIALLNQKIVYKAMFNALGMTVESFGAQHGGVLGATAMLHTWGRELQYHPHLHVMLPLGAYNTKLERFVEKPLVELIPKDMIEMTFKMHMLDIIENAWEKGRLVIPDRQPELKNRKGFMKMLNGLRIKQWQVYAEEKENVSELIGYLGKHKHSVAIRNEQIIAIDGDQVVFRTAAYGDDYQGKIVRMSVIEFIRRFLMHVLPKRFNKLRVFGLEHHRNKARKEKARIQLIREGALANDQCKDELDTDEYSPGPCPKCGCVHYDRKFLEKEVETPVNPPSLFPFNRDLKRMSPS